MRDMKFYKKNRKKLMNFINEITHLNNIGWKRQTNPINFLFLTPDVPREHNLHNHTPSSVMAARMEKPIENQKQKKNCQKNQPLSKVNLIKLI